MSNFLFLRPLLELIAYENQVSKLYDLDQQERNRELNSNVKDIFLRAEELVFDTLEQRLVALYYHNQMDNTTNL